MPSKRLEEAMRPTRYNDDIPAKLPDGHFTGKASEKPIEPIPTTPRLPYNPFEQTPSHEQVQAVPVQHQQPPGPEKRSWRIGERRVRETTAEDFSDLMDPSEQGPSRPDRGATANLPPDPFPLQYRNGDPSGTFGDAVDEDHPE